MAQWQAGFRPLKQNRPSARMSQYLRAIALTGQDRIKVYANPVDGDEEVNPDGPDQEVGEDWVLNVTRGKVTFRWNMSRMTEEELNTLKDIFMFAYENALPVAQARDKQAKEAAENGDDIFERRFRTAPHFSIVPRKEQ